MEDEKNVAFCLDYDSSLDINSEGDNNDDIQEDEEFIEHFVQSFKARIEKEQSQASPYSSNTQCFPQCKSAPLLKYRLRTRSNSPKLLKQLSHNTNNYNINVGEQSCYSNGEQPIEHLKHISEMKNQSSPHESTYTTEKFEKYNFSNNESTLRKIIREVIIERDKKRYENHVEAENKRVFSQRAPSQSDFTYPSGKSSPSPRVKSISPEPSSDATQHFCVVSNDRNNYEHFQWENINCYHEDIIYSQTDLHSRILPQQVHPCPHVYRSNRFVNPWNSNNNVIIKPDGQPFTPIVPSKRIHGEYTDLGVQEIFDRVRLLEESEKIHSKVLPVVAEEQILSSQKTVNKLKEGTKTAVGKAEDNIDNSKNNIENKLDVLISTITNFIEERQTKEKEREIDNAKDIEEKIKNEISKALTAKNICKIKNIKSDSVRPRIDADFMKSVEKVLVTESEIKVSKHEVTGKCREYKYEFAKNSQESEKSKFLEPKKVDLPVKNNIEKSKFRNCPGKFKITLDFNLMDDSTAQSSVEGNRLKKPLSKTKIIPRKIGMVDASTNTDPYWPDLTLQCFVFQSLKKIISLIPSLRFLIPIPNLSRLMSEFPRCFPCKKCGRNFNNPSDFGQHILSHGVKIRDCPVCENSLTSNSSGKIKSFQCRNCFDNYLTANCRKQHEDKCLKRQQTKVQTDDSENSEQGNIF